jgi:hypothetical protein
MRMRKPFSTTPVVGWLAPTRRPAGRRVHWMLGETPEHAFATATTMAAAFAAAGVHPEEKDFLVFSHPAALLPDGVVSHTGETTIDGRKAIENYFSHMSPRRPSDDRLAIRMEGQKGWLWGAKASQAVERQVRDALEASRKYEVTFLAVYDGEESILVCGERIAANDVRFGALRRRFPR